MWQQNTAKVVDAIDPITSNATDLTRDCEWLSHILTQRLNHYFEQSAEQTHLSVTEPVPITKPMSAYGKFVVSHSLNTLERLITILSLVPLIKPQLFDVLLSINEHTNRPFTEFGMVEVAGCVYATGATAAFILYGDCINGQLVVLEKLQTNTKFKRLFEINEEHCEPSKLKAPLTLNPEFKHALTIAKPYRPETSHHFPASRITSNMDWQDLILPKATREQLEEVIDWVKYGKTLANDWGIGKQLRPGLRALFYGPPGTGKTLTASLLGQAVNMDVYKVDLSMITSKYIGETEKNLEQVFTLAEHRNWILFFDEADALFGKRQTTQSSNDQFANQNVAYLLQRIERFDGVIILASNFKDNIDDAFFRRFESIVQFPAPKAEQRLTMWQNSFCNKTQLSQCVNLSQLAEKHPLSGAEIVNVVRFVSLKLLSEQRATVRLADIEQGIKRSQVHQTQPRW